MHAATAVYTRKGTQAASSRNDWLQQYAPLVKRIAHHMMARLPANVELDDLVQAGMIGLVDAIQRYEECQGTQFETYANQRIRGAMLDELRANDWLPRSVRKSQRQIEGAVHKLEQRLGRAPSENEIARELGMNLAEYQEMLGDARGGQLVYFDEMNRGDDNAGYLDRHLPDEQGEEPGARLADKRFREALVAAIGHLPEREKTLMSLYYEEDLNFREIAAVLGVTESRVCQLHSLAVSRLRAKLRDW
jgi:RNA polymerase sigma factor for flagellar operon FliA